MTPLVIGVVVVIIIAIVLLSRGTTNSEQKRSEYLQRLAEFLNTQVRPIEGLSNSFELVFKYDDQEFVFQDLEDLGFQSKIFRAILKTQLKIPLTLTFIEDSKSRLRSDIAVLEQLTSPGAHLGEKVDVPKSLKAFSIATNKPVVVNALFKQADIVKIFNQFKGVDPRGHPTMSLEIRDGMVVLEFHSSGPLKPSWLDLQNNASMIEEFIKKILLVVRAANQFEEKK